MLTILKPTSANVLDLLKNIPSGMLILLTTALCVNVGFLGLMLLNDLVKLFHTNMRVKQQGVKNEIST